MFESIQVLLDEHTELQEQLADPAVQANQGKARRVGRRYAELTGIVTAYNKYKSLADDLEAAREMASEDPDFAAEIPTLEAELEEAQERLRRLLIPRDPDDGRNVILEVKAGAGGDEAALFAGDLLRMYLRYAEHKGWKTEVISSTSTDVGGYKDAQIAIKGTSNEPAEGVWAHMKYEGGVHRVQRVPATESQGRIHTSVQSVNTTDSAVRITHLPTGIVVAMQNEKSQLQNREAAMRVLRARLLAHQQEQIDAENAAHRASQVRTMDRSERIRTYNFPENRIADHRTGYKAYNLDAVLDGDLDPVVQSAIEMDEAHRLEQVGQEQE